MADKPIPPKFRRACDYLMGRLWPSVKWPPIEMFIDDHEKNQGSLDYPKSHRKSAQLRMAGDTLFRDFIDTIATIAHELAHLRVFVKHGLAVSQSFNGHGPEWRAEMAAIGLPVPPGSTRENIERGGLFWDAYHEILAQIFMGDDVQPPLTSPAAGKKNGSADQGTWSSRGAFSGARKSSGAGSVRIFGPGAADGHHIIFADCSNSMADAISPEDSRIKFEVQQLALNDFVRNLRDKYSLYGYTQNIKKFDTPSDLVLDSSFYDTPGFVSGTKFSPCFNQAANIGGNDLHIHIFSDGSPEEESQTEIFRARGLTTCPISTYLISAVGDRKAIELMAKLARGVGKAHVVSGEADLVNAIRNEIGAESMPFSVAPRPIRNWEDERKRVLAHTGEVIKNQRHVLNIATTVADTAHQVGELQEEVKFLRTTNDFAHQIYHHANEALDVVSAQLEVDRGQRLLTSQQNDGWIEGAGAELSRQSSRGFVGQLEESAQRSAELHGRRVKRMTLTSLDPAAVARTTALMAGRGLMSLPNRSQESVGALPSPGAPIAQGNSVWGSSTRRELVPVKRES